MCDNGGTLRWKTAEATVNFVYFTTEQMKLQQIQLNGAMF